MGREKASQSIQQASGDLARLLSGELSAADVENIGSWPRRDAAYQKDFIETSHLLDELDALREDPMVDQWIAEGAAGKAGQGLGKARVVSRSMQAVAALLLLTVGAFLLIPSQDTAVDNAYRYVTRTGEQKSVTLPDGSVVNLNTNTRLLVSYAANSRDLQLLSGEAYFAVAKDAARPFNVASGNRVVTVLGTEFNLRKWPDRLALAVTEGVVALHEGRDERLVSARILPVSGSEPVHLDAQEPYRVKAGMVAEVNEASGQLLAYADPNLAKKLSWRDGVLRFEAASLSAVVEELNRYSAKQIVIVDPEVSDLTIYSTFGVNRIDRALLGIEYSLPIRIEQTFERIEIYKE